MNKKLSDAEIDIEIYEFMNKHPGKKSGTKNLRVPKREPNEEPLCNALPNYPDPNRGNKPGWNRAAEQQNHRMGMLYRKHIFQRWIGWTVVFIFWALVIIGYLSLVLR